MQPPQKDALWSSFQDLNIQISGIIDRMLVASEGPKFSKQSLEALATPHSFSTLCPLIRNYVQLCKFSLQQIQFLISFPDILLPLLKTSDGTSSENSENYTHLVAEISEQFDCRCLLCQNSINFIHWSCYVYVHANSCILDSISLFLTWFGSRIGVVLPRLHNKLESMFVHYRIFM